MDDRPCWYVEICRKHFPVRDVHACTNETSWECPIADKIQDLLRDAQSEEGCTDDSDS